MHPVCFHIGERPIYWYGVMMALAFIAGMVNWWQLGRRAGRGWEFASDLGFWMMVSGIGGARLAYALSDWRYFAAHPAQILRVDQGGLIFYGGFIGALAAVIVIARRRRENPLALGDFVVTALPLGHALGRVGCFLNGCCYGRLSDGPWTVSLEGQARLPVQLYEVALNLLIFAELRRRYRQHPGRPGHVVAMYALLYSTFRFLLEFFRGDDRVRWWGGLSVAQYISLIIFGAGFLLWSCTRPRYERISVAG
jgi:phosphatidylglycerol:prolipoprotein diacylglycerol transferase